MGFIELLYAWTFASFTFRIVHINARPSRVAMVTFDVINTFKSLTKHERCVEPRLTHKLSTDECRENQIFCTDKDEGNNVFFPDIEIVYCVISQINIRIEYFVPNRSRPNSRFTTSLNLNSKFKDTRYYFCPRLSFR